MKFSVSRTIILLGLIATPSSAQMPTDQYLIEKSPPPAWVQSANYVSPESPSANGGAVHYLVADLQDHFEEDTTYQHYALQILSEAGVEDKSQLTFSFNPEYETLTLHHLHIERDGIAHDRLAEAKIDVMRREEGLERQLYDGELTAHIILDDVRPGDILSYAFSRTGKNPVFNDHVHSFYRLGFDSPIDLLKRRLVWDADTRDLNWQVHKAVSEPALRILDSGLKELTWQETKVTETDTENRTPGWFFDYPWIEVSDYPSWKTVADWARELYAPEEKLPDELIRICNNLRQNAPDEESLILDTLRWVQRNIRYLGSFMGDHTHAPYPLIEVTDRRFGDCKDKGMMTVAMLRYLGFDAAAALVNTSINEGIENYLPGHQAFNHLIVHLRWKDQDYWLDPTYTFQRGPLNALHTYDYGFSLVMREEIPTLETVLPRGFEENLTQIEETFTIPKLQGGAELRVTTIATGRDANALRRDFATDSLEEFEESYRDFYAAQYPGLEIASPLTFHDNEKENRIEISEHYRIPEIWVPVEDTNYSKEWQADFPPRYLDGSLFYPEKEDRKFPMEVRHPVHIKQRINLHLPEPWNVTSDEKTISSPVFNYLSKVHTNDARIQLDYEFKSKSNVVPAEQFEEFQQSMSQVNQDLSYSLTHWENEAADPAHPSTSPFAIALLGGAAGMGALLGLGLAVLAYLWNPPARLPESLDRVGIGGWLILPMLGVVAYPFIVFWETSTFFSVLDEMGPVLENETGFSGWRLNYFIGVFINAACFPVSIALVILFFKKRTSVPWIFIGMSGVGILAQVTLLATELGLEMEEDLNRPTEIVSDVIRLAVWGSYMTLSQRVKATFVNQRRIPHLPPPLPQAVPPTRMASP
ncbi:MAG: DUF3857 domain-containing protein [Verrucomicrobiota bacterium]